MRKRMMAMTLTIAGLVMAMPVFGSAQTVAPEPEAAVKADRVMDFDGDLVEVGWLKPDQGVTEAVVRSKKPSLINIRTHFNDEIIRSADNL